MSEERLDQIENRLDRAEALLVSTGEMIARVARLSEVNSQQIESNSRAIIDLHRTMADLALRSANDRAEFEEWRRTTQAALNKMDRVLDYLMQRDGNDAP
ncbi:MAG: hypothetical protein AAGD09_10150 [Cyanobacteria bacterium P01_F01_bin.56]